MTGNRPDYVNQAASLAEVSGLTVAGTLVKPLNWSDPGAALDNCGL